MADVRGQADAKRALEIAAAGGHNLLMAGPPGAGKTMVARRLPGILPPPSLRRRSRSRESIAWPGLGPAAWPPRGRSARPTTRSPPQGLVGGGARPKPGEMTLAHRGVLFLDELAEFSRAALEALRQPLEEGRWRSCAASARSRSPPARCSSPPATRAHAARGAASAGAETTERPLPAPPERAAAGQDGPPVSRIEPRRGGAGMPGAREEPSAAIRERVLAARERQRACLAGAGRVQRRDGRPAHAAPRAARERRGGAAARRGRMRARSAGAATIGSCAWRARSPTSAGRDRVLDERRGRGARVPAGAPGLVARHDVDAASRVCAAGTCSASSRPIAALLERRARSRARAGLLALPDADLIARRGRDGQWRGRAVPGGVRARTRRSAGAGAPGEAVCRHGEGYPEGAAALGDPPPVLFHGRYAAGLAELAAGRAVALVGRPASASPYGLEMACALGRGLGGRRGHRRQRPGPRHRCRGAPWLPGRGRRRVAVVGGGPDVAYPRDEPRPVRADHRRRAGGVGDADRACVPTAGASRLGTGSWPGWAPDGRGGGGRALGLADHHRLRAAIWAARWRRCRGGRPERARGSKPARGRRAGGHERGGPARRAVGRGGDRPRPLRVHPERAATGRTGDPAERAVLEAVAAGNGDGRPPRASAGWRWPGRGPPRAAGGAGTGFGGTRWAAGRGARDERGADGATRRPPSRRRRPCQTPAATTALHRRLGLRRRRRHPGRPQGLRALRRARMTAITAITAQNTLEVTAVHRVPPDVSWTRCGRWSRTSASTR